jgi:hypothetical protein
MHKHSRRYTSASLFERCRFSDGASRLASLRHCERSEAIHLALQRKAGLEPERDVAVAQLVHELVDQLLVDHLVRVEHGLAVERHVIGTVLNA